MPGQCNYYNTTMLVKYKNQAADNLMLWHNMKTKLLLLQNIGIVRIGYTHFFGGIPRCRLAHSHGRPEDRNFMLPYAEFACSTTVNGLFFNGKHPFF